MKVALKGSGAVSPAGWKVQDLVEAKNLPLETEQRENAHSVSVRKVPKLDKKLAIRHPRLRRVSPVARYAVTAAMEAMGEERLALVKSEEWRVGVILTVVNGCVNYTRKFYSEVLEEPATASPILFPETVFNSPSSHLAALLGSHELNYTLLGDSTQFLSGVDLASQWLEDDAIDGCVIVGAEELDWLSSEAAQLFRSKKPVSEGAGAIYVERGSGDVQLERITEAFTYSNALPKCDAVAKLDHELQGVPLVTPADETFGFGMGASTAWDVVLAHQALLAGASGNQLGIRGVGTDQQAIGAILERG